MAIILFMVQLISGFAMLGIIWFVQWVHYPLFAKVGEAGYIAYQQQHMQSTGMIVGPLMMAEMFSIILMLFYPAFEPFRVYIIGALVLLAIIWFTTFFVSVPFHQQLLAGFDLASINKLTATNYIRTIAWTLKAVLMFILGIKVFG